MERLPLRAGGSLGGLQVTAATRRRSRPLVAAGQLVHRGRLVGRVASDLLLDQLDSSGAPLAPGESYLALLSAGPTVINVTKSLRAPVPNRPSAPPWEPILAVLPKATPEISATQITDLRVFDRYHARARRRP